jgi:hypothetical protein
MTGWSSRSSPDPGPDQRRLAPAGSPRHPGNPSPFLVSSLLSRLLHRPGPARAVGCGLLFCLLAARLPAQWAWSGRNDGSDLWLTASKDGAALFDLRLGSAGAIAELQYRPGASQDLLANPYGNNDTDRVVQWTLWSDSYAAGSAGVSEPFNEDLAGSGDGTFSPTVAVNPAGSAVDVYAVPQDQWDRSLNGAMQARYSALTRYEMLPDGVLKVRRVVLTGDVVGQPGGGQSYDVYFEEWNPFKVDAAAFSAFALSLDAGGQPDWWYRANDNVPYYQYLPATDSLGYAVIYQEAGWQTMPVIGVVYGAHEVSLAADPELAATSGRHVFNSMGWGEDTPDDQGIALLPALQLFNVPSGSVIDYTYYLVLRPHADPALKSELETLSAAAPAPAVYGPSHAYTGELAAIVATLGGNLHAPGVRTDHLGGLVIREAAPSRPAARRPGRNARGPAPSADFSQPDIPGKNPAGRPFDLDPDQPGRIV